MAHKDIKYIIEYAKKNVDENFYIHFDLKMEKSRYMEGKSENIFFIHDRVDVKWAGFSMVIATLNLFNFALNHSKYNEYFHLISGDDVILRDKAIWGDNQIFMECHNSVDHRYRVRFDTPHADTKGQRSIFGKFLTQFYKRIDKLFQTKEVYYFGSQWFSIRRNELEVLMKSITNDDLNFFRKKLCPDEHFFQYLVVKNKMLDKVSDCGNKRLIKFDLDFQHGSSPIFLNVEQLINAQKQNYWFARKVEAEEMKKFYMNSNEV